MLNPDEILSKDYNVKGPEASKWMSIVLRKKFAAIYRLAHYLNSIRTHTSTVEAHFSSLGLIKTKLRNRLSDEKLCKLGTVAQNCRRKRRQSCKKRKTKMPVSREYEILASNTSFVNEDENEDDSREAGSTDTTNDHRTSEQVEVQVNSLSSGSFSLIMPRDEYENASCTQNQIPFVRQDQIIDDIVNERDNQSESNTTVSFETDDSGHSKPVPQALEDVDTFPAYLDVLPVKPMYEGQFANIAENYGELVREYVPLNKERKENLEEELKKSPKTVMSRLERSTKMEIESSRVRGL